MEHTHDTRRNAFAWPLFSVGLLLVAMSRVFDNPILELLCLVYGYPSTMTGGILVAWKWVNQIAARQAARLLEVRRQNTLPAPRRIPFPQWQAEHFERFGPPK